MKKAIFFLFILCLWITSSFSQQINSFFSLRSGVSIPIGNFSSHNLNKGSFAQSGLNESIEGTWFFSHHLGVGGQVGFQLHPVNASALATTKVNADPFLTDLTIRSEPFQSIQALLGLYAGWPVGKNFTVTAKLLFGVLWAKTAYQLYKPTYYMTGPKYYEITSSKNYQLVFEPGMDIQHNLSHAIALKITTEMITKEMQFRFKTSQGIRTDSKQVGFVNVLLAMVVRL